MKSSLLVLLTFADIVEVFPIIPLTFSLSSGVILEVELPNIVSLPHPHKQIGPEEYKS